MTSPVLAATREELTSLLSEARRDGRRVGFVATMGALHAGHQSLIERARASVDGPVVVSIFVNPLQFAEGEDLDRYPRTLDEDLVRCAEAGANIVFAPSVEEVYPSGLPCGSIDGANDGVAVEPGRMGTMLEGGTRPGHFRGVLTVVAKLFGLVRPDVAVFGEKDYQQLALIQRMAADLCLGVEVIGAETLREPDGLAMSSRNRYLDAEQREQAAAIPRVLERARRDAVYGADSALAAARAELRAADGVDLDYLVVTGPDLGEAPADGEARILIAARVGVTRLIDNMPLCLGKTTLPEEVAQRPSPRATTKGDS